MTDADGHILLLVGVNEVSVVVTAEDGSFTVYALTVTRQTAALVPVDPPFLLNFRTNLEAGTGGNDPIEFSVISREEFQAAVVTARNYGPTRTDIGDGRAVGPETFLRAVCVFGWASGRTNSGICNMWSTSPWRP